MSLGSPNLTISDNQVELGAVVSRVYDAALPSALSSDTRFVGLEDIAPNDGMILNYSQVDDVKSRVNQFQNGDVLYGRLRPYLRKAAVADFDGAASGEIIVFRCSNKILARYLLIILLSDDFNQFVAARAKGDRPRISFDIISNYRIDLPTVEAQAEVCDRDSRLVAAMAVMSDARERLRNATKSLIEATRSSLIWNASRSVDHVPLTELVESIDYGTSRKSIYDEVGAPVLRIPNIVSGQIDSSDLKYTALSSTEMDKYRLQTGDILLIRSNGSLPLVGQAAIVREDHRDFAFAGYLLRMRVKNHVLSEYLLQVVRSAPFRRMIAAAARSSTGINNLSAGRLGAFRVPIMPIDQQTSIVDTLARLEEAAARSNAVLKQNWDAADLLQKTARRGWLGQGAPELQVRQAEADISQHSEATPREREFSVMDDDIETTLLRRIDALPSGMGTFEVISDGIRADYDTLRDVVFTLLATTPAKLEQVFDKNTLSMLLRRVQ